MNKWGKIATGAVALLATGVFGSYALQTVRHNRFVETHQLPGTMITHSQGDFYVNCQGNPSNPTIVFENGMGLASEGWDWMQRALAEDYHACAYDRAGIGFSTRTVESVDAGGNADGLAELLDTLGVTGPVIVVGHSYGGLIARVFADRYPARVAGLVLVDSSHEDMAEKFPPETQAEFDELLSGFSILQRANYFGGARLLGIPETFAGGLENGARARAHHLYSSVDHMAGSAAEASAWEASAVLAREVADRGLGKLPMSVVMVDGWPDVMMPSWTEMQQHLASLSASASFSVIEEADHFGVLTRPEYATQVVDAIRALADAAEHSTSIQEN